MKTRKCELCGKRYRIKTFHVGVEEHICFLCKVYSKAMIDTYGSLEEAFYTLGVYSPRKYENH